jgi:hypothetical protein
MQSQLLTKVSKSHNSGTFLVLNIFTKKPLRNLIIILYL